MTPRRNGWLALPLLAAVGMVAWLLLGSGPSVGTAGGEADVAAEGGGATAPATADEGGTLAAAARTPRKPAPTAPEAVVPTFTKAEGVYGRVLDSHEKGIPGAKVALVVVDPTAAWGAADAAPVAAATSGEGGAYLVGPAPTGRIRVRAEAAGYAATVVAATRGTCVDLILDRGGALRVHVRDPQGAPVKGAALWFLAGMFSAHGATGETGDALLENLPTGQAALRVAAAGRATVNLNDVVVESGGTIERTCVLGAGLALGGRAVDDATGAGIAGVEITVRLQWDPTSTAPPTATTEADGRFRIEGAGTPRDWVQVQATKEGYQGSSAGVMLQPGGEGEPQEVVLKMVRGAAAPPIHGTVVDAEGRAAAGATVLYVGAQRSGNGPVSPTATTDASGAFDLPLPTATGKEYSFQVGAWAPGKGVAATQVQSTRTTPLALRLGGAGTVSGKVTGVGGAPLEGAAVTLSFDWSASQRAASGGADVQPWLLQQLLYDARIAAVSASTDASGTYRIEGVPAAAYRVDASWGLDRGASSTSVTVRAGAAETVDVSLGEGKTIEGKVTDGAGTPVAGAYVNGWDTANRDGRSTRSAFARSDSDGAFKLRSVTGDRWQLSVFAAGFASQNVPNVSPGDSGVDVRLVTLGWIEGQVLADGKPFAGSFTVSAQFTGANESDEKRSMSTYRYVGNGMVFDGGGQREESFSAPDGRFVLRGVTAGPWKVNVTTADGWVPAATAEVGVSDGRGAGPVEVRLVRGATLSGTLTEEGSSEPVAGASVSVRMRGPAESGGQTNAWLTTDARGRFVSTGLAGGTYVLAAQTSAGYTAEDEVRLSAGQTLERDLVALHFGSVTVRVVDAAGKAVAGASVTLSTDRGTVVQPNYDLLTKQKLLDLSRPNAWQLVQQTDADGVNRRYHVPSGRISVKVAHVPTGRGATTTVDVAADRDSDVTVTLETR